MVAQSTSSNVCSTTVVETKNDTCPDGSTFSIMGEYEKPAGSWRIDFNVGIIGFPSHQTRF